MSQAHADPGPSLAHRTSVGFLWAIIQTLAAKFLSLASQFILARLLLKEDYGLVGMAGSFVAVLAVVQSAGLGEVLVRRQRRFHLWATPAWQLSLLIGIFGTVVVLGIAPLAAMVMNEPRLPPVLAVSGFSLLLNALAIVPLARLQIELRLKAVSLLVVMNTALTAVLSVIAAKLGWGPYAIVAPPLVAQVIYLIFLWRAARVRVGFRPQMRRWKYLFGDGSVLLAIGVINTIASQAPNLILGALHTTEQVGLFFFAFGLSAQTVTLLTQNLTGVMFPALSKLQQDPQRAVAAYVRASRVLALVGMPLCFLQAATADPLVRLLFPDWIAAIPLVQLLSAGMGFNILGSVSTSLSKAQGRFKRLLRITIWYTLACWTYLTIGGLLGASVAVAIAYAAYTLTWGPFGSYLVMRPEGGWTEVWRIYTAPAVGSAIAAIAAMWVNAQLPPEWWWQVARIPLAGIVMLAIYLPLMRLAMPDVLTDVVQRAAAIMGPRLAKWRGGGAKPAESL